MGRTVRQEKTLVLGLGNPIIRDDGVAFHVLSRLREGWALQDREGITLRERCIGGLDLLFETEGFDTLLLVDAYHVRGGEPGTVRVLESTQMGPAKLDWVQDHWLNLPTALEFGRRLGWKMPTTVHAIVVDIGDDGLVFGEELSPAVASAVPEAAQAVVDLLAEIQPTSQHHLESLEVTE